MNYIKNELYLNIEDESDLPLNNYKLVKMVFLLIFYVNAKHLVWYFIYHSKYLNVRQLLF